MRWAILEIKGLAFLSLDLIYHLKGKSQTLFHENVPLKEKNMKYKSFGEIQNNLEIVYILVTIKNI
jgi:hypothetical protein